MSKRKKISASLCPTTISQKVQRKICLLSKINIRLPRFPRICSPGVKLTEKDLISTGKSSLNAINALKSEGYNVMGMLSIFSYNFEFANKGA